MGLARKKAVFMSEGVVLGVRKVFDTTYSLFRALNNVVDPNLEMALVVNSQVLFLFLLHQVDG